MIARALALATASIVTLLPGCEGAGKLLSERENLSLLATIPTYPGARYVDVHTEPIWDRSTDLPEFATPIGGYGTSVSVAVPRGTRTLDVVRFYRRVLTGWRCWTRFETIPPPRGGTAGSMSCVRGTARLGVGTENLFALRPQFQLSITARSPA